MLCGCSCRRLNGMLASLQSSSDVTSSKKIVVVNRRRIEAGPARFAAPAGQAVECAILLRAFVLRAIGPTDCEALSILGIGRSSRAIASTPRSLMGDDAGQDQDSNG